MYPIQSTSIKQTDVQYKKIRIVLIVALIQCIISSCSKENDNIKLLHISISRIDQSVETFNVTAVFRPIDLSRSYANANNKFFRNIFSIQRNKHILSEEFDLPLPRNQNGVMIIDVNAASQKCGTAQVGQISVQLDSRVSDSAVTILLQDCDDCWCRYCQGINCGPPGGDALNHVRGTSTNDIWAVGDGGLALHWDGTVWSQVDSHTRRDINALYIINENDIWAVGGSQAILPEEPQSGVIIHWDGKNWSRINGSGSLLYGIWPINAEEFSIVGGCGEKGHGCSYVANFSRRDYSLHKEEVPSDVGILKSVWGAGASRTIWAVGGDGPTKTGDPSVRCPVEGKQHGYVFKKNTDKQIWTNVSIDTSEQLCNLDWLWGRTEDDIWVHPRSAWIASSTRASVLM